MSGVCYLSYLQSWPVFNSPISFFHDHPQMTTCWTEDATNIQSFIWHSGTRINNKSNTTLYVLAGLSKQLKYIITVTILLCFLPIRPKKLKLGWLVLIHWPEVLASVNECIILDTRRVRIPVDGWGRAGGTGAAGVLGCEPSRGAAKRAKQTSIRICPDAVCGYSPTPGPPNQLKFLTCPLDYSSCFYFGFHRSYFGVHHIVRIVYSHRHLRSSLIFVHAGTIMQLLLLIL